MIAVSSERKLAAIFHADVAGYSRLMGADEAGTHRALREHLDAMAATISAYHGRVVNYAGDAVLADFPTASDALSCAVTIQRDLQLQNKALPDERKLQFRIGINLGEVIVDREDIYGDGVNIAARLENLADAGGICISGTVYDAIGGKLPFSYEFIGEQQVKNISQPVRAYRVLLEPDATTGAAPSTHRRQPIRSRLPVIIAAAALLLMLVAGFIAYQQTWQRTEQPAAGGSAPTASTPIAADRQTRSVAPQTAKPSIAVLPFSNLSADPQQAYFADGMTEDLITDLSKVSSLFVIARHSVFAYKDKPLNIQQIGQELRVRYVLEGSVRKADDQIRINAQLIDVATGGHLWAERYDRQLQNIFALQDEITERIVAALEVKLTEAERSRLAHRYTDNLQAYDYFLRAQEALFQYSSETYEPARALYRRAIALDPTFARAYSALAVTYVNELVVGYGDETDDALDRALGLTHTAIALDDALPQAYFAQGFVLVFRRQHEKAIAAVKQALALDPNYADCYILLAFIYLNMGDRVGGAFELIEKAMRLNPNYTLEYLGVLGQVHYLTGQYAKALDYFQRALQRNPNMLSYRLYLISIYIRAQRLEDAEWEVAEVLALSPGFSTAQWAREQPFQDPAQIEPLLDDLRRAGLPE